MNCDVYHERDTHFISKYPRRNTSIFLLYNISFDVTLTISCQLNQTSPKYLETIWRMFDYLDIFPIRSIDLMCCKQRWSQHVFDHEIDFKPNKSRKKLWKPNIRNILSSNIQLKARYSILILDGAMPTAGLLCLSLSAWMCFFCRIHYIYVYHNLGLITSFELQGPTNRYPPEWLNDIDLLAIRCCKKCLQLWYTFAWSDDDCRGHDRRSSRWQPRMALWW